MRSSILKTHYQQTLDRPRSCRYMAVVTLAFILLSGLAVYGIAGREQAQTTAEMARQDAEITRLAVELAAEARYRGWQEVKR